MVHALFYRPDKTLGIRAGESIIGFALIQICGQVGGLFQRVLPNIVIAKLLDVDRECWREQLPQMREHYAKFGEQLPAELRGQLEALEARLKD